MPLAELALGAVVLVGLLVALAVRVLLAARDALSGAESAELRYRAWSRERQLWLASRSRIADGVQAGTGAVQLGSSITRTGHRAIASIPFGLFRAIPATREGSARVRDVHDGTAEVVYDTIETLSERIGEAVRRRMVGGDQAPVLPSERPSDPHRPASG